MTVIWITTWEFCRTVRGQISPWGRGAVFRDGSNRPMELSSSLQLAGAGGATRDGLVLRLCFASPLCEIPVELDRAARFGPSRLFPRLAALLISHALSIAYIHSPMWSATCISSFEAADKTVGACSRRRPSSQLGLRLPSRMDFLRESEGQEPAGAVLPASAACAFAPVGVLYAPLGDALGGRITPQPAEDFESGSSSRQLADQSALAGGLRPAGGSAALHCGNHECREPGTPYRAHACS